MKYFTILLSLFTILLSCDNEDNDDRAAYYFFQNSSITVDDNGFTQIQNGANLVFEYNFSRTDDPNIADDEFSERIIFEVSPNVDSFSFSNEELMQAKPFYDKYCFCVIEGSIPIENGIIMGEKINESSWEVAIDVQFDDFGTVTKTISGLFTLSERE